MSKKQMQEPKIPKRVQRILDMCAGGQTLCMAVETTHLGTKPETWFLEPSGKVVATISAREATRLPVPSRDGLFGADMSQTWKHPGCTA